MGLGRGGPMFGLLVTVVGDTMLAAKDYKSVYALPKTTAEDALLGARPGPTLQSVAPKKPMKLPSKACGGKKIDLNHDAYTGDYEAAYYRIECAHGGAGILRRSRSRRRRLQPS